MPHFGLVESLRTCFHFIYFIKGICIFIHIEHYYVASLQGLLLGAPNSSAAKKNSLKVRKE